MIRAADVEIDRVRPPTDFQAEVVRSAIPADRRPTWGRQPLRRPTERRVAGPTMARAHNWAIRGWYAPRSNQLMMGDTCRGKGLTRRLDADKGGPPTAMPRSRRRLSHLRPERSFPVVSLRTKTAANRVDWPPKSQGLSAPRQVSAATRSDRHTRHDKPGLHRPARQYPRGNYRCFFITLSTSTSDTPNSRATRLTFSGLPTAGCLLRQFRTCNSKREIASSTFVFPQP